MQRKHDRLNMCEKYPVHMKLKKTKKKKKKKKKKTGFDYTCTPCTCMDNPCMLKKEAGKRLLYMKTVRHQDLVIPPRVTRSFQSCAGPAGNYE